MKKLFRSVFNFLLFSNVFIALCAVAQALVTFHLLGVKPTYTVLGLLFASTLAIYNFSILLTKPRQPQSSPYQRIRWFFAHHRLMVTFTMLSLLSLCPLFFFVSASSQVLLILLAVISFGYSMPLFKSGDHRIGLRNIPGLKALLITLVWTLSCVLLPVLETGRLHPAAVTIPDTAILIAKRFLLIGALTVPFDVRDLFQDRRSGLKTIAVAWGEKKAYLFCQLLLAGYIALLFLFRNNGFNTDFWALTTTAALMGWLIFRAKWQKNEYYYFFYLDGVLVLQYAALVVFNLF